MADRPTPDLERDMSLLVQRVDLLGESLNNYTRLLGDLINSQENRLTNIEREFAGLRRETREGLERLEVKLDAQGERLGSEIKTQGERLGSEIKTQGERLGSEIKTQGERLDAKIDAQGERMDTRVDAVRLELEGKIDSSRSQTISTLGIFIGAAALLTSVATTVAVLLLG